MEWLNYHHLLYFWTVVREGGVSKAAAKLSLAQPTVSAQLRSFEEAFGEKLLRKSGRHLELTESGQTVYRYADEIFALGRELQAALRGEPSPRVRRLTVGVSEALPKTVAYQLLQPALDGPQRVQLIYREGAPEFLLGELAQHRLDLVLASTPAPPWLRIRAYNHLLRESEVSFFAAPDLARQLERGFPHSLHGQPFLMPYAHSPLGYALSRWFEKWKIQPRIVAEIEDRAMLQLFGQAGRGVFAAPAMVEDDTVRGHEVVFIGRAKDLHERFYAITTERRYEHPAMTAVLARAHPALSGSVKRSSRS